MNFANTQTIIALAALLFVTWRSRLKIDDAVIFFLGTILIGFLIWGQFDFWRLSGLSHAEMLPIDLLFAGGFCFVIFLSRRMRPAIHQGGIFLTSLTFLYLMAIARGPWRWWLLALFLPGFLFQLSEAFLATKLSAQKRFALCVQYGLCQGIIGLYQVSFLGDFSRPGQSMDFDFILQSFLIQTAIFWSFFRLSHLLHAMPFFKTGKYKTYLDKTIIPEYAAQVADTQLPRSDLLLAVVIHGGAGLTNILTGWISPNVMMAYLVLVSPKIVEFVISRRGRR